MIQQIFPLTMIVLKRYPANQNAKKVSQKKIHQNTKTDAQQQRVTPLKLSQKVFPISLLSLGINFMTKNSMRKQLSCMI